MNKGMLRGLSLIALSIGATFFPLAARAEEAQASSDEVEEGGWGVSVAARAQALYFTPHVVGGLSDFLTLPNYGGTVFVRTPDPRFVFSGHFFRGETDTTYRNLQSIGPPQTLNYHVDRTDAYGYLEYTPTESNISFLVGLRSLRLNFEEKARAPTVFTSNYEVDAVVVEVGARIAGKISRDSRHSLTAQIVGGYGRGSYSERTTGLTPLSEDYPVTSIEFAGGYTYRATDKMDIGLRLRGFTFATYGEDRTGNQFGERSGGGYGPELNATVHF